MTGIEERSPQLSREIETVLERNPQSRAILQAFEPMLRATRRLAIGLAIFALAAASLLVGPGHLSERHDLRTRTVEAADQPVADLREVRRAQAHPVARDVHALGFEGCAALGLPDRHHGLEVNALP